jgi:hypothetical protein
MARAVTTKSPPLFSPASANRALRYVRGVVKDLVEASARLKRAEESRARATAGSLAAGATERERAETLRRAEDERTAARLEIARIGRELESVGVEVKDPVTGLVDFPGEIGGRRVHLCWRHGEERVAFWHELEAGFRGRRPLEGAAEPDAVP